MIGHHSQWTFLQSAAQQDTLAQAYLFLGPRQVGKRLVADQLAALLLCQAEQGSAKPCKRCEACQSFGRCIHQDFLILQREADEQVISIEAMRAFLSRLRQSPSLSARKVAIVDGAEDLSAAAANAFLKQLEEPTASTTIILVCHDRRRLLPTIFSRCQTIEFDAVHDVPAETAADPLWQQSHGLPGRYTTYKQSASLAQLQQDESSRFWELFSLSAGQRFALLESYFKQKKVSHSQQKDDWDQRLHIWQQSLRDNIADQTKVLPIKQAVALYDQIGSIRQGLNQNINVRSNIESFLLALT